MSDIALMKLHMRFYIEDVFYVTYLLILMDKVQLDIIFKPYRFNDNHTNDTYE